MFQNLSGVKGAGGVFAILEEAALERLDYFTVMLAIPEGKTERPDHTTWYSYPLKVDKCVRAADFEFFSKIDRFELAANMRQLRDNVKFD